jgi:TRAP-type C4-dicarboxylate transport system substrate-binding protein
MNRSTLLCLASCVACLAGCGSSQTDKSGARGDAPVTLTLEVPDRGDPLATAFARAVTKRSQGSVHVRLADHYDSARPANELKLAHALEDGRADMGYLPARAWSAAGLPAFSALLAPFVVTTDQAAQALATSDVAGEVLDTLPHSVIGLALVPAETRRVISKRAVLAPGDFAGQRLRIIDNPQTAALFTALGALPQLGWTARPVTAALADGRLDGAETAPNSIVDNGYWNSARQLSGYGVFPKFQSIVSSREAWRRMSPRQRDALLAAARETVGSAHATIAARERSDLRQLCLGGVRIAVPTARQLQALATAAAPAAAELRADAVAARVLERLRALPGSGPQPLASPLPPECAQRGPRAAGRVKFPEGTYLTRVTREQFEAAGATPPAAGIKAITLTTELRDGRFTQLQAPTEPHQCGDKPTKAHPACTGTYSVDGDELTFVWEPPTPPPLPAPETVQWSYFDHVLRFKPVNVGDAGSVAIFDQPWRRIR